MKDEKWLMDVETIAAEIKVLNVLLGKLINNDFEQRLGCRLGLKNSTALGVINILNHDSLDLAELSKRMAMPEELLVLAVELLAEKGLVQKTTGKAEVFVLTQSGRDVVAQIPLLDRNDAFVKEISGIDKGELRSYLCVSRRLIAALSQNE